MPMMKATRRLPYYAGRARAVGEEFDVEEKDVKIMRNLGAVPVVADVQSAGGYETRVMTLSGQAGPAVQAIRAAAAIEPAKTPAAHRSTAEPAQGSRGALSAPWPIRALAPQPARPAAQGRARHVAGRRRPRVWRMADPRAVHRRVAAERRVVAGHGARLRCDLRVRDAHRGGHRQAQAEAAAVHERQHLGRRDEPCVLAGPQEAELVPETTSSSRSGGSRRSSSAATPTR